MIWLYWFRIPMLYHHTMHQSLLPSPHIFVLFKRCTYTLLIGCQRNWPRPILNVSLPRSPQGIQNLILFHSLAPFHSSFPPKFLVLIHTKTYQVIYHGMPTIAILFQKFTRYLGYWEEFFPYKIMSKPKFQLYISLIRLRFSIFQSPGKPHWINNNKMLYRVVILNIYQWPAVGVFRD